MNIKKAGIFTNPRLKGRFALSKNPEVKKPIEPIDAITNPIAAELPIALLIGYPKYLKIGTFIIAPVIPIGADINPDKKPKETYIQKCLKGRSGPVIAASDYIRSHVDQIRPYINSSFYTLGTDGYGRSDTRKELRKFFEVNKESIIVNTLSALSHEQKIASKVVNDAIKKYKIDPEKPYPIKL